MSMTQEQEIEERLREWEGKYSNTSRTARMLEDLRDTHATAVDTLMNLGSQGEQLNAIAKGTQEQEEQVKKLGKYRRLEKYMRRAGKKIKDDDKPKPKHVNQDVNRIKAQHEADVKIYNRKQEEKRLEQERKQHEIMMAHNNNNNNNGIGSDSSDKNNPFLTTKGKSKTEYLNNIETRTFQSDNVNEEDLKDNVFIQRANWIKVENQHLDEMSDILQDLKQIGLATQTEVQSQGLKMDDISLSMDRGSDFSLKKKSKKKLEKEQKKKLKEEQKRIKKESQTKEEIEKRVDQEFNSKTGGTSSK
eukprot:gene5597-6965_t